LGIESSHQIWNKLQVYYASQTQLVNLKLQLHNPKCDCTIATFLLNIKKIVYTLAAVGSPITNEDYIEVTSIRTRLDPYTVEDVESLLLA